ncbi:MAG: EAL domain-containing protein [Thermoleophilia bacterium]|nr:EAL domain-containing protein [Thermoleophilia bacterium]
MFPFRQRPARFSIRQKFLVAGVASTVVLAAIGLATVTYTSRELRSDAREHLSVVADLEVRRVEQQLHAATGRLAPVTGGQGIRRELLRYLGRPTKRNRAMLRARLRGVRVGGGLRAVSVWTPGGRLVAAGTRRGGAGRPAAPAGAAREAVLTLRRDQRAWFAGRAFPVRGGGAYVHAVAMKVGGRTAAVLVAELGMGPVESALTGTDLGRTADLHLVQRDPATGGARFVTQPEGTQVTRFITVIPPVRASAPAVQAIRETPPVLVEGVQDYRNTDVIAALRPIDGTGWRLVVKVDESEAFEVPRRITMAAIAAFATTVGILGLVLLLVSRSVSGRIRRVTEKATAISRGDLAARVGDPSRDELGLLAGAFDRMADTLSADIGRRRQVEAQLEHQAAHDELTGLPNRTRFQDRLATALATPGPSRVAVLFCDLDEFKSVNDELGHAAGDQLLTVVAQRFRAALRPADMLARFGGDEFVVVCTGIGAADDTEVVATRLQAALADPIAIGTSEAFVTVSIGIALDGPDATPESMVRDADAAMYRAKELGRRRHVTHDEEIRERAGARLTAATDLRRAIEQGRLALEYQPILHLDRLEVAAMEALVRWPRDGGDVPPSEFIGRAQELGLGGALDRWVLRTATAQLAAWRDAGGWDELCVTVNVAPGTLAEPGLADEVAEAVAAADIPAGALVVEVTEEAFALAGPAAIAELARLRDAGVRIAIDDFGTGHSSLGRLRELPVDVMKLDRRLVEHVDSEPQSREIVRAVLQLAATLEVQVVAEGVERAGQHHVLAELGCACGQGFHFARPAPAEAAPPVPATAGA